MQIIVNALEVREIILDHVKANMISLDGEENLTVEAYEDGSISVSTEGATVSISGSEPSTGEKTPKRTRRTKAQIEADARAEEEARQEVARQEATRAEANAAGNAQPTQTTSVEVAQPTEVASSSDAVIEEKQTSPGIEPEVTAEPEVQLDPEPLVDLEPEPEVEAQVEVPASKPVSLFANLRKPNNG